MNPREMMNKLKWHYHELDTSVIHFVHRGAPNDIKIISGSEIKRLDSWYFVVADYESAYGESWIPYHRVSRIYRDGKETRLIWERKQLENSTVQV